jgi:hypothetical protein
MSEERWGERGEGGQPATERLRNGARDTAQHRHKHHRPEKQTKEKKRKKKQIFTRETRSEMKNQKEKKRNIREKCSSEH